MKFNNLVSEPKVPIPFSPKTILKKKIKKEYLRRCYKPPYRRSDVVQGPSDAVQTPFRGVVSGAVQVPFKAHLSHHSDIV